MPKWEKVLTDFRDCSERLERGVKDLSEIQLDLEPAGGSWTARQIIHHLADGLSIWSMFIHQALAGKNGEFKLHWYWDLPQEEWADIWNYQTREIEPSLEIYRAVQERLLPLLEDLNNPTELGLMISIQGRDSEFVSIQDAVRIQVLHLREHLAEIRKVLEREGE
jgi:hypothetical protein